jgi:hypothetical protein
VETEVSGIEVDGGVDVVDDVAHAGSGHQLTS